MIGAMEPELVRRSLLAHNPWWTSGTVPPGTIPPHRRCEYPQYMEALDGGYVVVLAGMRRSGKSTLLHQAIEGLLARGVDAKDIVYASFDDIAFIGTGPEAIQAVLDGREDVVGPPSGGRVHAFLDEVQNIPDWGRALKAIWDLRKDVTFTATGSSGLVVRGAVGESLAGRSTTMELGPMTLRDWVAIASEGRTPRGLEGIPLAELLDASPSGDVPGGRLGASSAREAVRPRLGRYLVLGGLPEAALATDETAYLRHLFESVVERTLFRDLTGLYGLRQPDKVARLLLLLADSSGLPVSVDGLAHALRSHRETVEDYIGYLLGSRLTIELLPYTGSEFSSARKRRRYYIADTGLRNSILHLGSASLTDEMATGALAEQAVAIHLARLARRHWARLFHAPVHRGSEVDFVLETGDGPLPVECKYRSRVRDEEVDRLEAYRAAIGAGSAVMVTRDTLDVRGGCLLLPLWSFLLVE
jgi:predicted AAA+ superfamily ATPase